MLFRSNLEGVEALKSFLTDYNDEDFIAYRAQKAQENVGQEEADLDSAMVEGKDADSENIDQIIKLIENIAKDPTSDFSSFQIL